MYRMIWIIFFVQSLAIAVLSQEVNVTQVTETSITLSWFTDSFTNFTVQYGTDNDLNNTVVVTDWTDPVAVFTIDDRLESGQLYTFKVLGYNKSNGELDFTPQQVTQATKPYPVSNVTTKLATSDSLELTWEDPLNSGNNAVSYVVAYSDVTSGSTVMEKQTNDTSIRIDTLQPGHVYSVYVSAIAYGIRSNASNALTDNTVPSPPVSILIESLNESSFDVSWTPDALSEQDSFEVSYKFGAGDEIPVTCQDLPLGCTVSVSGGLPGDSYTIYVTAVKGERKSIPLTQQANTKPLKPIELKITNRTTTALQVMWKGAELSTNPNYNIRILPAPTSQPNSKNTTKDLTTVWFEGLTPGQTYQIQVSALSGTSQSEALQAVVWTVPSTPVLTKEVKNTSIIIRWGPLLGHADNVTVEAKNLNSSFSKRVIALGTDTVAEITGLFPGNSYSVTVEVLSGDQRSKPAVLDAVTTDPNPVSELKVTDRDTGSARITWLPPGGNTQFDRYKLLVHEVGSSRDPIILPASSTTYNVTGLNSSTQYIVEMTTVSGSQESTITSIPLTTRPPSIDNMTVTVKETSVTVTWFLPENTVYHSINISLSNASGIQDEFIRPNTSTEPNTYTFDNLASGEQYRVTITTMLSDNTKGEPSEQIVTTRPEPIKAITVTNVYSYEIDITWEPPANSVPIRPTGYLITVTDLKNDTIPKRNETVSSTRTKVLNLLPGHYYKFTVQAYVSYEDGPTYSTEVSQNVTTKPLKVVGLSAEILSDRILVTWSANGDSNVDEFFFQYRSVLRDPQSAWTTKHTVEIPEKIMNPFPGEKYEIRVQSKADIQLSNVSEIYTVIVPEPPKSVQVLSDLTTSDSLFLQIETDFNTTYASSWNISFSSRDSPVREITVDNISNPVQLSPLGPGQTFTITVYSVTVDDVHSAGIETNGTVKPISDTKLTEESATNSSIMLGYTENSPTFDLYHFQLDASLPTTRSLADEKILEYPGLRAGQVYKIAVWVSSSGVESNKQEFLFQTLPNNVKALFDVHPTKISVTLIKPPGLVDTYNVSCLHGTILCGNHLVNASGEPQVVDFNDLTPFQDYSFNIVTSSGEKSVSEVYAQQTGQTAPSEVQKVRALITHPNTVLLRWERPAQSNGEITQYTIRYRGHSEGKPVHESTTNLTGWKIQPTNITLKDLTAGYMYTFLVRAYTVTFGPAGEATLTIPQYPPPFKDSLKTEDILPVLQEEPTPSTVRLKFINAFSDKGGEVIAYTVIVSTDNSTEQKTPLILPGWLSARDDPAIKAYQAIRNCTDFFSGTSTCGRNSISKRNTGSPEDFAYFTVGTETDCDKKGKNYYCNGPLKPDTEYYVALRAFTEGGPSDTPYSQKIKTAQVEPESDPGAVIGAVLGSLAVLAIIGAVVGYWCYRRRQPKHMYKKEDHEMNEDLRAKRGSSRRTRASRIIPLVDFEEHYLMMSADSDYRFAEEFEELREVGRDQACDAAELPQNRAKNRFTNILPYDHSRVKLLPTDDEEGSDYINANYMPGYHSRREYIVTQGPLPSTRDDFWRMLWEQNARNIIMLTRCVEKGREKCDHYWPQTSETMFYGDLQVAILNETKLPDWTVTEFRLSLGDNSRKVRHFHYTAWPDFGVPERPQSLVKFVETVQSKLITDGGPKLVHCSAGVGRSGTFIALDRLLQHIKHNDWVDPYSIVHEMRCQRVWMVQTEQQYICIHQCLLTVLQGIDEEPVYCNFGHDNVGFEDDEGINVEIM